MPRPKGSKNKAPRKITVANNDFEALIAEKTSAKENLTAEITSLEDNLTAIKADLKAKKAELISRTQTENFLGFETAECGI